MGEHIATGQRSSVATVDVLTAKEQFPTHNFVLCESMSGNC